MTHRQPTARCQGCGQRGLFPSHSCGLSPCWRLCLQKEVYSKAKTEDFRIDGDLLEHCDHHGATPATGDSDNVQARAQSQRHHRTQNCRACRRCPGACVVLAAALWGGGWT